jgi:hypothetical protein
MTVNVQQKPVLDKYGNIRLNALEGLDLPVKRLAANGDPIDISSFTYNFYVEGVGVFPVVDGADAFEKRIQVTPTDLANLVVNTTVRYALVDESGPVPVTLLEGNLKLEGFRV